METVHYLMEYKTGLRFPAYIYEKIRYCLPFLRGKYEIVRSFFGCTLRTKIISSGREGVYIAAVLSEKGISISRCMLLVQKKSISLSEVKTAADYRRQGYGKKMIKLIKEEYAGSGKTIRLHVMKENRAAIHLYGSLDFEIRESLVYYS